MFVLMGCSSLPDSTQLPIATRSIIPNTVMPSMLPTPMEWLSYNPNACAQGCDEFTATLAVTKNENLSQLEISRLLFEIYVDHYQTPHLGGLCRLQDFKVERA